MSNELDYPFPEEFEAVASLVHERAIDRYEFEANERGKGERWRECEPRYHLYKAHDELSSATHISKSGGEFEVFLDRVADAYNHVLMAVAIGEADSR